MALSCFDRALVASNDETKAEIWYNVGHIGIGIGDLGLAYQAFKISVSHNPSHAESFNNLGVLELRKGNVEQAKNNFLQAARLGSFLFEPLYNVAYLNYKRGDFQQSYTNVTSALELFPEHADSNELVKNLKRHFSVL
jgi:tetratricopeptide repeat protein 8